MTAFAAHPLSPPAGPLGTGRWESPLFVVLLLGQLLPIWMFAHFPSEDGPAHVETAHILHDLIFPTTDPAAALERQYYQLNPRPVPNLLGHAIMAGLMLVAPPFVAEKILLSLYALLLPLAARYALRAMRPSNGFLAILVFPIVYNPLLQMGFYNFSLGLIAVLWMIGYWLAHAQKFTAARAAVLGVAATLAYFSHLFCLGLGAAALAILCLWMVIWKRPAHWKGLWARTAAAFVPALVLCAWLGWSYRGQTTHLQTPPLDATKVLAMPPVHLLPAHLHGVRRLLYHLAHFDSFAVEPSQVLWSDALAWTVGLIFAWRLVLLVRRRIWAGSAEWQLECGDGLLGAVAALLVIYLLCRRGSLQAYYFEPRAVLGMFLMVLLWLGTGAYGRGSRTAIQIAALVLTTAFLTSNLLRFHSYEPYQAQCDLAADHLPPNSVFLPLNFAPQGWDANGQALSAWHSVFDHVGARLAVATASVNLGNYQSDTDYFPIIYRPQLAPTPNLFNRDGDFLDYPRRTGGRVDAVVLYGLRDTRSTRPQDQAVFRQLDKAYDLAYESPGKAVRIYLRKDQAR